MRLVLVKCVPYSSGAFRIHHIDKEEIIFIAVLWEKNKGFFNIKGYAKRMSLYIIYSRYDVSEASV